MTSNQSTSGFATKMDEIFAIHLVKANDAVNTQTISTENALQVT